MPAEPIHKHPAARPVRKHLPEDAAKPVDGTGVGLGILDFEDAKTTARKLGGDFVDVDKAAPAWMRQFMFRILKSNEVAV